MNILITGSNRGIGFEAARQLGVKGHTIFITARSDKDLSGAVASLMAKGVNCSGYLLDLSSTESIDTFVEDFAEELDVLVNNAGVYLSGYPSQLSKANLLASFYVNTIGPWYLSNKLIPKLSKSQSPKIINVSSGAGAMKSQHYAPDHYSAYRISKLALNEFTRLLSQEYPKWKINAMCPGWVRTRMGGSNANRSVAEGADTITWLALENEETGNFYRDRKIIPW
ncbi:MAG: SDR family NAD(P)-dependent oxidoreductase [Bacteroidota bacterium]